jgi:hypothetical protein
VGSRAGVNVVGREKSLVVAGNLSMILRLSNPQQKSSLCELYLVLSYTPVSARTIVGRTNSGVVDSNPAYCVHSIITLFILLTAINPWFKGYIMG